MVTSTNKKGLKPCFARMGAAALALAVSTCIWHQSSIQHSTAMGPCVFGRLNRVRLLYKEDWPEILELKPGQTYSMTLSIVNDSPWSAAWKLYPIAAKGDMAACVTMKVVYEDRLLMSGLLDDLSWKQLQFTDLLIPAYKDMEVQVFLEMSKLAGNEFQNASMEFSIGLHAVSADSLLSVK